MTPPIGYALRDENRPFTDDPNWSAVEIDFQRANHPLRVAPYLSGTSFGYVSVHALELSVSSPDPPVDRFLDELIEVARENGALAITDHLGFTHGQRGGAGAGHVMTAPLDETSLDATCRNIDLIQHRFAPFIFYLENLAHFFVLRGTMREATFFTRLLKRTGCGLLLDVTNAYANQRNYGVSAAEFIREVVAAAPRIQMHLAGGFYDPARRRYFDSHSEPIPEEVWDLYRVALSEGRGKVDAVFIERDWNFPDANGWHSELVRARAIFEEVEALPCGR
jgi:uncharacterized protein (UPF0276 family)